MVKQGSFQLLKQFYGQAVTLAELSVLELGQNL